jgi:hypothetical protein
MRKVSHNDRYSALQEEYLKTRDNSILEKMYGIAKEAAHNYLTNYSRRKGIRFNTLHEMSHDSSLYVIEQYLRKPEFKVIRISSYIHFGVLKTLFKNKDLDMKEFSYEEYLENGRGQA